MTQYTEEVERHSLLLKATEWAREVAGIHSHSLSSMYYDNRPEDTEGSKRVTDVEYNCGVIARYQKGEFIHQFNEWPEGHELISRFEKYAAN